MKFHQRGKGAGISDKMGSLAGASYGIGDGINYINYFYINPLKILSFNARLSKIIG